MMRDPGLLRPILELSPGYLDAAFDEVWRRYGSFEAFLARGLDLDSSFLYDLALGRRRQRDAQIFL